MKVHFIQESQNRKTGKMPVTYTEKDSCPDTCPLKKRNGILQGCYGDDFYTNMTWDKVAETGKPWSFLCDKVSELEDGTIWRHNIAGDLPHKAGKVSAVKVASLVKANRRKKGFTYSHHLPEIGRNSDIFRYANSNGFTINLSANNDKQAETYFRAGFPVTVITDKTENYMIGDIPVTICPAQKIESLTCKDCQYCAKADRKSIVGFTAHGSQKKKVIAIVRA